MKKKSKFATIKTIAGTALISLSLISSIFSVLHKNILPFLFSLMLLIVGAFAFNTTEKTLQEPIYFILIILLLIPVFIAYMIISIKSSKIWFDNFDKESLISLYGSILAYAGTVALGLVASLQNARITDITEKSVNGDIQDKKGFLLPKVYTKNRVGEEVEASYSSLDDGICLYNAGNDYIHSFKIEFFNIEGIGPISEPTPINFIGLESDSKKIYLPLNPEIFENDSYSLSITFLMTNSKGFIYKQILMVSLQNVGHYSYKVHGYDTHFPELEKSSDRITK